MKASFKASLVAIAIATLPLGSQAAGLGQINVTSGLGQPLRAEIPLHASPQELKSLSARLASAEAFRQANIPYSAAASGVRVAVDTSSQRPVLRLSSQRPVNDPFIELLLELNWSSGQLLRQYTFLLDPVDLVSPKPVAADIRPPVAAPRAVAPVAAPVPATSAAAPGLPSTHQVRKGETLHRIAGRLAPPGVNLDQMLVGLLRANPGAFDEGNINRLRSGAILSVPAAARLAAIEPGEARREVLAQASDFEAYRRRLAGVASTREAGVEVTAGQTSGGQIVPRVEETRPSRAAGDQLQVSRNDAAGRNDAAIRLQMLEEELVAREKSLHDANNRLGQLEQSVRSMQSLLELTGKLPLPSQAVAADSASAVAPPRPAPAAELAPPAAVQAETPPAAPQPAPNETTASNVPANTAAATGESRPEAAAAATPEAAAPAAESSVFDDALLADLTLLGAGGAVVALLLAYIALRRRRLSGARAAVDDLDAFEPQLSTPATQQEIMDKTVMTEAGEPKAEYFANEPRAEPAGAAPLRAARRAAAVALDDGEGVDPVAEAEVYMAYGRDAQAVEILLDAMRTDPARTAIHVKLLEIYAQHKSVDEFATVARLLHARTGGQGGDWVRAALLGSQLDPANTLYGRSLVAPAAPAMQAPAPAVKAPPAAGTMMAGLAAAAAAAAARPQPVPPAPPPVPLAPVVDERAGQSLSALDFTASQPFDESFSEMKETWVLPGQNAQYGNMGDPAAAPSVLQGETMAPPLESGAVRAAVSGNVIDFDLGLDDTPSQLTDAVTLPALEVSSPGAGLDAAPNTAWADDGPVTEGLVFDMDLGDADEVPSKLPLQTVSPAEEARSSAMLDLDFDLPSVGAQAAAAEPEEAGLNPYTLAPDPDTARLADTALEINFNLDFPAQDAELPGDTRPEPDVPTAVPFELSAAGAEAITQLHPESIRPVELAAPSTLVADVAADDFETKLQLVRVYDEMGDREAALALLDEIVREVGLARPEVRKMIARLG